ncbi:hypothetical protein WP4W18E11_34850 [Acinetobacter baumannii]|nr:hypothetical protein WP4W18E11_34850 [Acinetobacter baumannii]
MKKVAVILSGCGYLDGSEIRESVLTLLALDTVNIEYQIFAPDEPLFHVIDHVSGEINMTERRNILQEAGRIARGKISSLDQLNENEFDGLILPGGFGVAKNLSTFAFKGAEARVHSTVASILKAFHQSKKPIGAICISPALLALTFGELHPCLDNAVIESFFGILKSECFHGEKFQSIDELEKTIREYIHYYNHERIKVKLQGLSPVQYRNQFIKTA